MDDVRGRPRDRVENRIGIAKNTELRQYPGSIPGLDVDDAATHRSDLERAEVVDLVVARYFQSVF